MNNNDRVTFQPHPNQDELVQAFEGGRFFCEESLEYILGSYSQSAILVAKIQGRIIGAIMYRILPDWKELKIDFVEVISGFRGKGIGVELIRRVEDVCSGRYTQVCASLNSSKNRYSKKIFAQAGFAYDGKYCFTK